MTEPEPDDFVDLDLDLFEVFLGIDKGAAPISRLAVKTRSHTRPRGYAPWKPQKKTRVVLDQVVSILNEYEDHLPLTVRQVFYRLVGAYGYPKDERAYSRLCEYLNRARRAKMIPFQALRDDGISVTGSQFYGSVEDFWDETARRARNYRIDRQQGQRQYVELWCEAAGMMPQLRAVADEFSVPVYSNSGFVSLPSVRSMVDHALGRSVPTVIVHVGDLDPSGSSIFTAMTEDASAFVEKDRVLATQRIVPVRVALTGAQVVKYQLPTAPPKRARTGRAMPTHAP